MKTWDDWSDEDLANAILIAIHGEAINHFCLSDCETYVYDCGIIGESFYRVDLIDINNPNDMWPLMLESGIVVLPYDTCEKYIAVSGATLNSDHNLCSDNIWYLDEKPLRAAAIVFLEMNGVKP